MDLPLNSDFKKSVKLESFKYLKMSQLSTSVGFYQNEHYFYIFGNECNSLDQLKLTILLFSMEPTCNHVCSFQCECPSGEIIYRLQDLVLECQGFNFHLNILLNKQVV